MTHALLGKVLRRLLPEPTVIRVLSGELRGRRWLLHSSTNGCWAGTYERPVQRLFKTYIQPGDVVYDLGANVGFFTLLAAKLAGVNGQVIAFEPLPRNLVLLRRHLELNGVTNATVFPLAIARAAGVARFNIAENPSMGSLEESGTLEVETASLDELVRSGAIAPPSFMKIDVEGGEHDLLTGAASTLSQYRPAILLSTHGYRQHELCWSLLAGAAYKLELLRDGAADGDYLVLARR